MPDPRVLSLDTELAATALFSYEGTIRLLVASLKFHNRRSSLRWFVPLLAAGAAPAGQYDVVTWVPGSKAGRRQRGFDVARTLAAGVAAHHAMACRATLTRRDDRRQVQRSRLERLGGPVLDFPGPPLPGARVLLIDDVVTTGSTLVRAAAALRQGGAASVDALVIAAAPLRSDFSTPLGPGSYTERAACGSVVESRCQSQAKRPT